VHIYQTASYFERAHSSVVLVLHPGLGTGAGTKQRPADLGCGRDHTMHQFRGGFQ